MELVCQLRPASCSSSCAAARPRLSRSTCCDVHRSRSAAAPWTRHQASSVEVAGKSVSMCTSTAAFTSGGISEAATNAPVHREPWAIGMPRSTVIPSLYTTPSTTGAAASKARLRHRPSAGARARTTNSARGPWSVRTAADDLVIGWRDMPKLAYTAAPAATSNRRMSIASTPRKETVALTGSTRNLAESERSTWTSRSGSAGTEMVTDSRG